LCIAKFRDHKRVQLAARTNAALLSHDLKLLKYGGIPLPELKTPLKKQASDVTLC
jgi:hypothetical protein